MVGMRGLFFVAFAPLLAGCLSLGNREEDLLAARRLTLQGIDAAHQQRLSEAAGLFERAIKRDPDDARSHYHYARLLWRQNRPVEAITKLEEAVRLSAGDPLFRVELGRMYLETGAGGRAEEQARAALQSDPQLPEARALLGDVLAHEGRFDDALAQYFRALNVRDRYPEVQLAVAEIYRAQNRPQRALAAIGNLTRHQLPEQVSPRVQYLQGLALKELRRFEDASDCFRLALARQPQDAELYYQLAECQLLAGQWTTAQAVASDGLTQNPQHPGCRGVLDRLATLNPALTDDVELAR